jgi:hypothetical protein
MVTAGPAADFVSAVRQLRSDVAASSVACRLLLDMLCALAGFWSVRLPLTRVPWLTCGVVALCSMRLQRVSDTRATGARSVVAAWQREHRQTKKMQVELQKRQSCTRSAPSCYESWVWRWR